MNYSQPAGPISFSTPNIANQSSQSNLPVANTANWVERSRRRVILCFLLLIAFSPSCSLSQKAASAETSEPQSVATPSPSPNVRSVQVDTNLAQVLDLLFDSPEFGTARWGVAIIRLRDGKLIYQRNGDKLFTPASNMKVYTTAVALDLLGADYHWRTSVYSDAEPDANGIINGDLVLYGRGAPDLSMANRSESRNSLEELADALSRRGLKRVHGNVVGDESYFRGDPVGEGWQWNDLQWYFGAEASALSINGNSSDISIMPAVKMDDKPAVVSSDQDGYIKLVNNLATVEKNGKFRIGVHRGLSDNNVVVWGEVPLGARGYGVNLSVHRPALWAARLFARALRSRGITVDGEAGSRDSRVPEQDRFNPNGKQELAFVSGKSLAEIVKITNKQSVNLFAELILRTLGRERAALLQPQNNVGREHGDEEAGVDIVRLWLSRAGIKTTELAIHDGSGLSRMNLVTPEATARLLEAINRTSSAPVFSDSLPLSGTDGTLAGRLGSLAGKVKAKTGTLTYDNSLSGYLTDSDGQELVFSVFCNDSVGRVSATHLIDRLVIAIAGSSHSLSPNRNSPAAKQNHR